MKRSSSSSLMVLYISQMEKLDPEGCSHNAAAAVLLLSSHDLHKAVLLYYIKNRLASKIINGFNRIY